MLRRIKKFRDQRDWMQFHNPKDMAEAISIEAAELLEHFLWKTPEEAKKYVQNKNNLKKVADELSDIFSFVFELADNLGVDIEKAFINKLKKNVKKYPIKKVKGKATKYNRL